MKIQMDQLKSIEQKRANAMSKMQDGITPETQKELNIQNALYERLQKELSDLIDHNNDLTMRASSRGGRRLAPLPGVSIPLNEFEDNDEYKQQIEVDEESPHMEPNQEHIEEESPNISPSA